jgi:hypothetical protein
MIGCLVPTLYGLLRGILYPVADVRAASRHYNFPRFVAGLLKARKPPP